jgi:hypothetical protein
MKRGFEDLPREGEGDAKRAKAEAGSAAGPSAPPAAVLASTSPAWPGVAAPAVSESATADLVSLARARALALQAQLAAMTGAPAPERAVPVGVPLGVGLAVPAPVRGVLHSGAEDAAARRRENAAKRSVLHGVGAGGLGGEARSGGDAEGAKMKAKVNPYLVGAGAGAVSTIAQWDPRMKGGDPTRRRAARMSSGVRLVEAGKYAKQGDRMREAEASRKERQATRRGASLVAHGEGLIVPGSGAGGEGGEGAAPAEAGAAAASGAAATREVWRGELEALEPRRLATHLPPDPTLRAGASGLVEGEDVGGERRQQDALWLLGVVPDLEWWDAALLPQEARTARREALGKLRTSARSSVALERVLPVAAWEPGADAAVARPVEGAARGLHSSDDVAGWAARSRYVKLVEHPVPVPASPLIAEETRERPLELRLTTLERRKERHLRRVQNAEHQRLLAKLGLVSGNTERLRQSSLTRSLAAESTLDPTAAALRVRQALAERQAVSDARNAANKLTPEERQSRRAAKMTAGAGQALGWEAALYRVTDLSSARHRFRIHDNARRDAVAGVAVLIPHSRCNLVLVVGGARAMVHLRRVILRRIRWEEARDTDISFIDSDAGLLAAAHDDPDRERDEREDDQDDDDDDDEEIRVVRGLSEGERRAREAQRTKYCELVWRGSLKAETLGDKWVDKFRFEVCASIAAARKLLNQRGLGHFVDVVAANVAARNALF